MARFNTIVRYEDETFDILEIPKRNSALVKEYEDFVSARADLDYLVADLNMVGKFTQMAYNGVAGYTDLQIKIRRIGVNVSRLCDQSTMHAHAIPRNCAHKHSGKQMPVFQESLSAAN